MRTFIAIELDDAMRDALAGILRALQGAKSPMKLKWVAPQHQHLTLHFFGEIQASDVDGIARALELAVVCSAPFDIALAQIGCFPNIYKPNVLWVGVQEPSGALQRLQKSLATQFNRIPSSAGRTVGFPSEARPFAPHLTLARVPRKANARDRKALGEWFTRLSPPPPTTATVRPPALRDVTQGLLDGMCVMQIHLMQSELLPSGPRYTPLHVVELSESSGHGSHR